MAEDAGPQAVISNKGLLLGAALNALFVAVVIIYARLDSLLGADVRVFCFPIIAAVAILGVVGALAKGQLLAPAISVGAGVYIIFNLYLFDLNFGTGININAAFAFAPLTTTAFFWLAIDSKGLDVVIGRLIWFAIAYACIYLALSITLVVSPSVLPPSARETLIIGDGTGMRADARGDRIVGYLALLMLGWFAALLAALQSATPRRIAVAALFAACMALTNSRMFLVCVIFITAAALLVRAPKTILSLTLFALAGATIFYIASILTSSNPFALFEYDASGAVRMRSFEVASHWIQEFPWFGVGTAPSGEIEQYYVVGRDFYLTDLGPVGILYSHGIVGLLLWLGLPLIAHLRAGPVPRANIPIYLAISTMALYQIIAPVFWYGGGTAIFAFWLATTIKSRQRP